MNNAADISTERSLHVYRGTVELLSGDVYQPGETLTVKISDDSPQFVFEIKNGYFPGGGCHGRRISDKAKVDALMPLEEEVSAPLQNNRL
jgi:hypothetical protein